MSRYFMVQSWVGSHENEPDYNGNQCGERNVRSSEVVPLYDQYGNANIQAFSDEALSSRKKTQTKTKSVLSSILLADRNYERLCGLSEQLDVELDQGLITDFDAYCAARKNIDARLAKAWERVQRERGWDDQSEELPDYTLDEETLREHSRGFKIDYSILHDDSLFSALSDDNLFKIMYTKVLTVLKQVSKVVNVAKQIIHEGVI